ncbi:MAG: hypothetical protein ABI468_02230, partial [Candidatus Nanopelagicales bacterium]
DQPRPGDVVTCQVTYAAPHHLVSDVPVSAIRRTRAGDAWAARQDTGSPDGEAHSKAGAPVLLGLPTMPVLPTAGFSIPLTSDVPVEA